MSFTITKRFRFAASHILGGLPEGHKCGRLHGHNYEVVVELEGDRVDGVGFIRDYGDLDPFRQWLMDHLDHRHLNDRMDRPTAEVLAAELFFVAGQILGPVVSAVTVAETPDTTATYRP